MNISASSTFLTALAFITATVTSFVPIASHAEEAQAPQAVASPTPTPTPAPSKKAAKWIEDQRKACDRYYPGAIQAGIRRSCHVGGVLADRYAGQPTRVAETGCRLQYGEEPSETYACLIGTKIAKELDAGTSRYLTDLQLCSETYSVRTDLDTYLLESCLTGIHAKSFSADRDRFETCRQITAERSFLGPCAVGVSLSGATTASDSGNSSQHRLQCEKYFDHLRFHQAYRTCLNARAVSPEIETSPLTIDEIRSRCDMIVSDNGNDHERGACVIGAVLLENKKKGQSSALFDGCGVNQVRYEDRDVLGCLAAGSFLSFSNANTADRLCREIFRDRKSLALSGCLNAISTLGKSTSKQ